MRWSATPAYFQADEGDFLLRAARDPDAHVVWRGRAGDDGCFVCEGLPAGRWDVSAVAADGARSDVAVFAAVDGVREAAVLTLLAATETLRGQVLGTDGRAVACRLLVAGRPVEIRTDGTFEVHGLCAGPCDLAAEGADCERAAASVHLPRGTSVTLRLRRPARERVVRVLATPGATPIEGVEVRTFGCRGPVARTDRDGRARVPLDGRGWLRFGAEGYASVAVSVGQQDPTEEVEVRLARAARIEGRVRSAVDGRALEGVLVEASAGDFRVTSPRASAVSDADGAYVLADLVPGLWTVVARGPTTLVRGLASMPEDDRSERLEFDPLLVDVPAGTMTLDLEMVPGAVLRGRVLDAAGAPVQGADVVVYAPRAPTLGGPPLPPVYWERYETATDADGRYEFAALVPGRKYVGQARVAGVEALEGVRTPADGRPAILDFRLPPSLSLDVRVVDEASGLGLPGILVGAVGNYEIEEGREAVTGEDGWARLGPVPRDALKVRARRRGGRRAAEQAVDFSAGAPAASLVLRMPVSTSEGEADAEVALAGQLEAWIEIQRLTPLGERRPRRVEKRLGGRDRPADGAAFAVTVLGADGAPVPAADLVWWDSGDRGEHEASVTDGSAGIEVPESVANRLWVEVREPRDSEGAALPLGPARVGPLDVRAGRAEVRLPAERMIEGRVVGPDGRGVRGLRLRAVVVGWAPRGQRTWRGEEYPEAHTDGTGAFRLRGLAAGPYYVAFDVPGEFAPVPPSVHESGESGVEFRLRPCEVVSVRMVDPAGQPVAGASVVVDGVPHNARPPLPPGVWTGPRQSGESGADGSVRIAGMAREVPCDLEATPPPGRKDLEALEIEAWVPESGDLAFPGLATVSGVARDGDGAPIPRAHVEALRGHTWESVGRTGADGSFVVRVPTAGRTRIEGVVYEVERGDPDGVYWGERTAHRSEPVEVEAGASGVVLVVDRGVDLTVQVSYPGERAGWEPGTTYDGLLIDEAAADSGRPWAGRAGSARGFGDLYRFHQLRADRTYAFWLAPDLAGFYVLAKGLRPARGGAEVRVEAVKGRPVTGRIVGPSDVGRTTVSASQGFIHVYGESAPGGRFTFPGLPEGEWRLRADVRRDDRVWTGQAIVQAGDEVDLKLEIQAEK